MSSNDGASLSSGFSPKPEASALLPEWLTAGGNKNRKNKKPAGGDLGEPAGPPSSGSFSARHKPGVGAPPSAAGQREGGLPATGRSTGYDGERHFSGADGGEPRLFADRYGDRSAAGGSDRQSRTGSGDRYRPPERQYYDRSGFERGTTDKPSRSTGGYRSSTGQPVVHQLHLHHQQPSQQAPPPSFQQLHPTQHLHQSRTTSDHHHELSTSPPDFDQHHQHHRSGFGGEGRYSEGGHGRHHHHHHHHDRDHRGGSGTDGWLDADESESGWSTRPKRPFVYSKKELLSFFQPSDAVSVDFNLACGIFSEECLQPVANSPEANALSRTNAFSNSTRGRSRGTGRMTRGGSGRGTSPVDATGRYQDGKPGKEHDMWKSVEDGDAADEDFSAYGGRYDTATGSGSLDELGKHEHDDDDEIDGLDQTLEPDSEEDEVDMKANGWFYIDPKQQLQGPFSNSSMRSWHQMGYFPNSLQLKRGETGSYVSLGALGASPFGASSSSDKKNKPESGEKKTGESQTPSRKLEPWLDDSAPITTNKGGRPSLLERLNITSTPISSQQDSKQAPSTTTTAQPAATQTPSTTTPVAKAPASLVGASPAPSESATRAAQRPSAPQQQQQQTAHPHPHPHPHHQQPGFAPGPAGGAAGFAQHPFQSQGGDPRHAGLSYLYHLQTLQHNLQQEGHRLHSELYQVHDDFHREQKLHQYEQVRSQYTMVQQQIHAVHLQLQQQYPSHQSHPGHPMMMSSAEHQHRQQQQQQQHPGAAAPVETLKGTFNLEDIEPQLASAAQPYAHAPAAGTVSDSSAVSTPPLTQAGSQSGTPAPWSGRILAQPAPSFKAIQKSELSSAAQRAAVAQTSSPAALSMSVVPGREVPSVDQIGQPRAAAPATASPATATPSTVSTTAAAATTTPKQALSGAKTPTSQWGFVESKPQTKPLGLSEIQKQQAQEHKQAAKDTVGPRPVVEQQQHLDGSWSVLASVFGETDTGKTAESVPQPQQQTPVERSAPRREAESQTPAAAPTATKPVWSSGAAKPTSLAEIQQQEARARREVKSREAAIAAEQTQQQRPSGWGATWAPTAMPSLKEIQLKEQEAKKQAAAAAQAAVAAESLPSPTPAPAAKKPQLLSDIMKQEEQQAKNRRKKAAAVAPTPTTVSLTPWSKTAIVASGPLAAGKDTDDFWGASSTLASTAAPVAPAVAIMDFPALPGSKKAAPSALPAKSQQQKPAPAVKAPAPHPKPAAAPVQKQQKPKTTPAPAPAAAKPPASPTPSAAPSTPGKKKRGTKVDPTALGLFFMSGADA